MATLSCVTSSSLHLSVSCIVACRCWCATACLHSCIRFHAACHTCRECARSVGSVSRVFYETLTTCASTATAGKVLFFKHMAKHLQKLDQGFLQATRNVILCRHPAEILASWSATLGDDHTSIKDIGLDQQVNLLEILRAIGQEPIVVVNDSLIRRPEGTLRALCAALGIDFQKSMMKWPKGGRLEDGLWAKYWYHNTHAATGFSASARTSAAKPVLPAPLKAEVCSIHPCASQHSNHDSNLQASQAPPCKHHTHQHENIMLASQGTASRAGDACAALSKPPRCDPIPSSQSHRL
jgi:hypothetical protein